ELAIPGCADQKMDVRRAHAVSLLRQDHAAHGPVEGNIVAPRTHRPYQVPALVIAVEYAAAIHGLGVLLDIVEAVGRRLPHRDLCAREGLAGNRGDASEESDLAVACFPRDLRALLEGRCLLAEERSKQARTGCRLELGLVVHDVDERA